MPKIEEWNGTNEVQFISIRQIWYNTTNHLGEEIDKISIGDSVLCTNVSVRNYDQKALPTSPSSTMEIMQDIGGCNYTAPVLTTKERKLHIDSVNCNASHICSACHKYVESYNSEAQFFKCQKCGMKQKTSSIQSTVRCQIMCAKERFVIGDAILRADDDLKALSPDEVENYLLLHPNRSCFTSRTKNSQNHHL